MIQHHTPLAAHLAILNAKARAWVEANPGSFHSGVIDDVKFWNEQGIFTPEQFERSSQETLLWDYYKSVHGISPRWMDISNMSDEEIQKEIDLLERATLEHIAHEKEVAEMAGIEKAAGILDAWAKDEYEHSLKFAAMEQEANSLPEDLAEREEELFHLVH